MLWNKHETRKNYKYKPSSVVKGETCLVISSGRQTVMTKRKPVVSDLLAWLNNDMVSRMITVTIAMLHYWYSFDIFDVNEVAI